jgi:hypothetical protein
MPGPFVPTDALVGPIVAQLIVVTQQIQGIGRCYAAPPEGEPEDNSVVYPLKNIAVLGDTNAKLKTELNFEIVHFFLRTRLQDAVTLAQTYVMPWFYALSDWTNQSLGGLAIRITIHKMSLSSMTWGQEDYITLSINIGVLTEFNIPTA